MVITKKLSFQSRGHCDVLNITPDVVQSLNETGLQNGIITVFISGSTAGITTIEYEPGVVDDLKRMWERTVPTDIPYDHDQRWGDGNGYSHVRASLLGASLVVPFSSGRLSLGTWQQVVAVDFDNRPRSREVILQIMGD